KDCPSRSVSARDTSRRRRCALPRAARQNRAEVHGASRMLASEAPPRRSLALACDFWEQAVGGQKFDHIAVEQRRLLDLAGMAGAVENLQFAAGDALLQREGGPVRVVLATGDDDGWTGDLGVMALGLGLPIGLELGDDGVDITEPVAVGEQVGKEMGHRRRAERGAEVLKGVAPTVADAAFLISLDAWWDEFLLRVVAGAAHDQRRGPLRAVVVHPDQHR